MSDTPSECKYVATHEWARLEEDGTVAVGISDHAQNALGDVVYVELPEDGQQVSAGEEAGGENQYVNYSANHDAIPARILAFLNGVSGYSKFK